MIYKIKKENIRKIALFDNQSKKYPLNKIKSLTGCTTIINCSLFNMANLKPVTHVKIDGIVKASDQYKYWGYAFNTNSKELKIVNDYSLYDNYFTCVCMVKDGQKTSLSTVNADLKGSRGRTGIGTMDNGDIIIYCSKDGTAGVKTPEKLQEIFYNLGVKDALMLDSGGSSQGVFYDYTPGDSITSNRIVSNLLLIWEKDFGEVIDESSIGVKEPNENENNENDNQEEINIMIDMPDLNSKDMWLPKFPEPTEILKTGNKGDGVKWLQTILQRIGFLLEVDGNYGADTLNAVIKFQKYWSLNQGEQVGENTKRGLKEAIWGISASEKELINVATAEICRNEASNGDDKYILWYNNANGTKFATTVAWCAIFVSWCMRRAGIDEKLYPNYASCSSGCKIFEGKGLTRNPKEYSPKSGDLIFYDFNNDGAPEHTGIVFANDGKYVYTIEGNSNDAVKHNKYLLSSKAIYKYVDLQSQFSVKITNDEDNKIN